VTACLRILLSLPGLLFALAGCDRPEVEITAEVKVADSGATVERVLACDPGYPCDATLPVKVVLVTLFERGADEGDAPGEFQLWKERRNIDVRIPFPHSHHDLYYDPESQLLVMVTGVGTAKSATATMALGLDTRFDLSRAYWLVAGIAGIDPEDASIGSAAWSAWLVDGDLSHEIDPREVPEDWRYGYFARRTQGPNDPDRPEPNGEVWKANEALRDWAFELTRDVALPDYDGLAEVREQYTEHPNARRPPFVLTGGHIAALTFWHGAMMNDWANDWVRFWTDGATDFVTSAMEETGTYQALSYLHDIGRVDRERLLVLRAGSNYTMPPPGVTAAENLLRENEGYAGMTASLETLYTLGSVVIDELLSDWPRYRDEIPGVEASAP